MQEAKKCRIPSVFNRNWLCGLSDAYFQDSLGRRHNCGVCTSKEGCGGSASTDRTEWNEWEESSTHFPTGRFECAKTVSKVRLLFARLRHTCLPSLLYQIAALLKNLLTTQVDWFGLIESYNGRYRVGKHRLPSNWACWDWGRLWRPTARRITHWYVPSTIWAPYSDLMMRVKEENNHCFWSEFVFVILSLNLLPFVSNPIIIMQPTNWQLKCTSTGPEADTRARITFVKVRAKTNLFFWLGWLRGGVQKMLTWRWQCVVACYDYRLSWVSCCVPHCSSLLIWPTPWTSNVPREMLKSSTL